jgi:choline dehydrogenase-like flavoprotein
VLLGEVVLCGGAINSPQTLQVSGSATRRMLERSA